MLATHAVLLADLIALHEKHHGSKRLHASLGDGYLYAKNPIFRRVRNAALDAGFRYSLRDPAHYFGFPLISLQSVLETRVIPFRDSFGALRELERSRPRYFRLSDLHSNRPQPNYLMHESAHAIAFRALFGRPRDVDAALGRPDRLAHVMLCESFAMASEYFAACMVTNPVHAWLFSISSYRRRTQKKKAVGELIDALGFESVAWCALAAFLYGNHLRDRLDRKTLERIWSYAGPDRKRPLRPEVEKKLRAALNGLMQMSPEFRLDTSRLFLNMVGYERDIRRVLAKDPLELLAKDADFAQARARLCRVITG